jgi:hypothetical protein
MTALTRGRTAVVDRRVAAWLDVSDIVVTDCWSRELRKSLKTED